MDADAAAKKERKKKKKSKKKSNQSSVAFCIVDGDGAHVDRVDLGDDDPRDGAQAESVRDQECRHRGEEEDVGGGDELPVPAVAPFRVLNHGGYLSEYQRSEYETAWQ